MTRSSLPLETRTTTMDQVTDTGATVLPILAVALLQHDPFRWSASISKRGRVLMVEMAIACVLYALPPHTVFAFWRPGTRIAQEVWPYAFHSAVPAWLVHGGPLGQGCAKLCEVLVGWILWRVARDETSLEARNIMSPFQLGRWPSAEAWVLLVLFATAVNAVLSVWSHYTKSRGDHSGVNAMVESSVGRELSWLERSKLVGLAVVNAICEEASSRGLWRAELQARGRLSAHSSNFVQAAIFGLWHYHGIPSGWTGVGLTFVYGFIMGILQDYGRGLLLPVAAHSIADYFIFAVIARRKAKE